MRDDVPPPSPNLQPRDRIEGVACERSRLANALPRCNDSSMRHGRCSKPTPKGWPISAAATSGLAPWADDRGHNRMAPDLRLIEVLTPFALGD